HSTGAVIGSKNGLFLFVGIGLSVSPRTRIPMSKKQHAFGFFRTVTSDNIPHMKNSPIIMSDIGFLLNNACIKLCKFCSQIISASAMSIGIGYTWAKTHLCFDISIGAIGIEFGSHLNIWLNNFLPNHILLFFTRIA